jgi:hypothetical protein
LFRLRWLLPAQVTIISSLAIPSMAAAQYSAIHGFAYDVRPASSTPIEPSGTEWNTFTSGTSLGYFRFFVPYNYFGYYNGSSCVDNHRGMSDNVVTLFSQLESQGITPVVVLEGQTSDDHNTELCGAGYMLIDLATEPGGSKLPSTLYLSATNETDREWNLNSQGQCNPCVQSPTWLPASSAADLLQAAVTGEVDSGYSSHVKMLGGEFSDPFVACASGKTYSQQASYSGSSCTSWDSGSGGSSYASQYWSDINSNGSLPYLSGWSVHDYDDVDASLTQNWCYDTSRGPYGPYGGCTVTGMSNFDGWVNSQSKGPYSAWITEAGTNANPPYGEDRAATDLEYLSNGWATVGMWYDWVAGDNPSWDSALLNSDGTERASYGVIARHESTCTAQVNYGGVSC